jgi:hypothetical protein
MDIEALVVDAFEQLGIEARLPIGGPGGGVDLLVDPDGVGSAIQLKHRSLVTEDVAVRLIGEASRADATLMVVADRVTDAARKVLTARRGGYLDLRGRLALRAKSLVVDAEVQPVSERSRRTDPLSGRAGLEVATALLMQPDRTAAVRELAREVGRAPSTVSEVLAVLRGEGLTDAANAVAGPDLFWRVAERWATPRTNLAAMPNPGTDNDPFQPLGLNRFDVENRAGWALTDSVAAAIYGAPVAATSGQVHDFFVPDQSIVRRAITLLGSAASPTTARCTVRVAVVPAVCARRVELATNPTEWPLAHPLFVALDLAQDVGRGREILDAWTPDDRWTRVW